MTCILLCNIGIALSWRKLGRGVALSWRKFGLGVALSRRKFGVGFTPLDSVFLCLQLMDLGVVG